MSRIGEQLPERFNLAASMLLRNLEGDEGERIAFHHRERSYSYRQTVAQVRRSAGLFAALGVERENRVAILLGDSAEFVFAFWGAVWLGAVPVPINTAATLDDIRYIIGDCRARVLLTDTAWRERLGSLDASDYPFLREVLLVDGEPSFSEALARTEERPHPTPTARDEPAFWLYTSGSTGRPKGVIHSHRGALSVAEFYGVGVLGLSRDDRTYSIAKLPFAYGLGNSLYMPMAVGAAAVLSDATNAFDVIEDIRRYRPTVFFGIPAIYSAILAACEVSEADFSSVRLCVSAAEQLPRTIWSRWKQTFGQEICEGIGTTELMHIFLSNVPGNSRPGSSGKPVPGYDVRLIGSDGGPVPPGEIGLLEVGGESLMLGYWNRLDATREALVGGRMATGDRYLRDEDGFYYFMGRRDDFFKVNGMWVSPFEIEEALLQHPAVLDAAVVPSAGDQQLTEVIAYVSLKPGSGEGELGEGLRRNLRSRLPAFKVPKTIHILDQLPRTSTGKIHRKALRMKVPV